MSVEEKKVIFIHGNSQMLPHKAQRKRLNKAFPMSTEHKVYIEKWYKKIQIQLIEL